MKVLLLYPRFPDTFWSLRYALRFVRKRSALPPLGLLTVAAMLPRDWQVRLVDANVSELTEADLAWADLALVSAMGVQKAAARELIARCRAAGLKVVAGGPLFTAEAEEFPEVDHLVLNEAELTLPPFLADLQRGCARRVYRSGAFADLAATPIPRWDLLKMKRYYSMGVQYSRGCPFNCEFCDVTALLGRTPRTKSTGQVIAELDSLLRAGWRGGVFFVDDNLIGNKKTARGELLPALAAWQRARRGRGVSFNTQASINLADDPALLEMLARAGFDLLFIGIETPDDQALAECGKGQNRRRDLLQDVKRIQHAGLQVQGGFIVGFDSDGPGIFQRQIDFIQRSGIATAMVGLLQALPGTALHERLRREGRLRSSGSGDNVDGRTNIVPVMDPAALHAGYRDILRSIYAPRGYYRRVRTFLREYRAPPIHLRLRPGRLLAFVRSLFWLGVVGRERLYYWHLLGWTLLRRPGLLAQAVTLAISGHHFRRVCERHVFNAPACP